MTERKSRAQEWAENYRRQPVFKSHGGEDLFWVDSIGNLAINKGMSIRHEDALRLRDWLSATFDPKAQSGGGS